MSLDHERAEEKKEELADIVNDALEEVLDEDIRESGDIVDNFVETSPPEKEEPKVYLTTLYDKGRRGGKSVKPGNITINMKQLVTAVASGVLTVTGAATNPWTIPFAAIVLWDKVWSGVEKDISEQEAIVLWTMWKNRDSANRVSKEGLLEKVNSELQEVGRQPISEQELDDSVSILRKIKCIDTAQHTDAKWYLREWIRVKYR